MASLQKVRYARPQEIVCAADNIVAMIANIMLSSAQLGLNMRQVGIFCRNTPGHKTGEDLWSVYCSRENSHPKREHYNFAKFMKEVLAEAGHPID